MSCVPTATSFPAVATAAALNRDRKHQRVLTGTRHAALVFDGDVCVGWCQFGPPGEVVRIKNRREYKKCP